MRTELNQPKTTAPDVKYAEQPLSRHRILQTWWPLAGSWLLMSLQLPSVSIAIARLPQPEIHLAAYGSIVHPVAIIIEAPILMLLAASTALSKDWNSFHTLRRYMWWGSGVLTVLHILVAFTPLFDVVVVGLIGAPAEVVEPARIGLKIMTPWTALIAYRRFYHGMLIRFGYSRLVGLGTVFRLITLGVVIVVGYTLGTVPGVVVAAGSVITAVFVETLFTGLRAHAILQDVVKLAPRAEEALTLSGFLDFYIPLAMTSVLLEFVPPVTSAALSRMPQALESLAVWPIVTGLLFLFRSLGVASQEVVVALLDVPRAVESLRRFVILLATLSTGLLLVVAATPLSEFWFTMVMGLSPQLGSLARTALWIALPIPALTVLRSWYQGVLVHFRRTRSVTVSVTLLLLSVSFGLGLGVIWGRTVGLYIGWAAIGLGSLIQTVWLGLRSRSSILASRKAASQWSGSYQEGQA